MTWILGGLGVCVVGLFFGWLAKTETPETSAATEPPGDHEAPDEPMDQYEIAKVIRKFFKSSGGASLRLPDGWFGRPYDNAHRLSSVDWDGPVLHIVLDRHDYPLTLVLREPRHAHADKAALTISGSAEVCAELPYYGDRDHPTRVKRFSGGTVQFFA